jgi:hypothetical protein
MTTQLRLGRSRALDRVSREMNEQDPCAKGLGRLIPVALALYLTPVLLIVLLAGGVGMLVLAVARVFTAAMKRPDGRPHPSGQTRSPHI